MKKWIITYNPSGMAYVDIGHGMAAFDSRLWLWFRGKLETCLAADGTHETFWGPTASSYWRGRAEIYTCRLSAAQPMSSALRSIPVPLLEALDGKFGSGGENFAFGPS